MDVAIFEAQGFADDAEGKALIEAGRTSVHPYSVQVLRKGLVSLAFEQNSDEQTTFPMVCIVSGPKGSVACNPDDSDLVLQLAQELE